MHIRCGLPGALPEKNGMATSYSKRTRHRLFTTKHCCTTPTAPPPGVQKNEHMKVPRYIYKSPQSHPTRHVVLQWRSCIAPNAVGTCTPSTSSGEDLASGRASWSRLTPDPSFHVHRTVPQQEINAFAAGGKPNVRQARLYPRFRVFEY